MSMREDATKILDYDAYLLEAKTQYGVVRVWISPDAGNNCLKWEILKAQTRFYRDGAITDDQFTHLAAVYDVERIERIDGRYVTTQAKCSYIVKEGDKELSNSTQRYKLTNIDFDPDYEAMGAFKIQLPEGTVVSDGDFPDAGVKYRWTGERLETVVDESVIGAIDTHVDQLRQSRSAVPEVQAEPPEGEGVVKSPAKAEGGQSPGRVAATLDAEDTIGFWTDTKKYVFYVLSAVLIVVTALCVYRYKRQEGRHEM